VQPSPSSTYVCVWEVGRGGGGDVICLSESGREMTVFFARALFLPDIAREGAVGGGRGRDMCVCVCVCVRQR